MVASIAKGTGWEDDSAATATTVFIAKGTPLRGVRLLDPRIPEDQLQLDLHVKPLVEGLMESVRIAKSQEEAYEAFSDGLAEIVDKIRPVPLPQTRVIVMVTSTANHSKSKRPRLQE